MTEPRSLRPYNTLGLEAYAREIHRLNSIADVLSWREAAEHMGMPRLALGGGSNVVFAGDYEGSVGLVAINGIEHLGSDSEFHYVQAGAGENWHGLVRWTLERGLPGLENLSLIPGSVGAAPMQNIGAYGVELSERFESLDAIDLNTGERRLFELEDCRFGYRDSRFKRNPERWLIMRVLLKLPRRWAPVLDYAGLREELSAMGAQSSQPREISQAVCRIRRRKLPDPEKLGNVGSFFKNPVVSAATVEAIRAELPALPRWTVDGGYKLSAAWLIEQCGWKGRRVGDAGVHDGHALVLVNHGRATGADIWRLARQIRDSVQERFGIGLEPEPRIIGGESRTDIAPG